MFSRAMNGSARSFSEWERLAFWISFSRMMLSERRLNSPVTGSRYS